VDAAYTGVESDGSESRPWKTIGAAVAAAASNAIVAVARGSYVEDVAVSGKPVKLWGVCPDEVELVGTGVEDGALFIGAFASGSEVHGLAMRGAGLAVVHSGSEAVIFDRVWVHDAAWVGIYSDGQLGPTSFVMRGSLVESNHEYGVLVIDGEALVETSSVRNTLPGINNTFGRGIEATLTCTAAGCDPTTRSRATIQSSLIEGNHEVGVSISASDATMEGIVVRGTLPQASDQRLGRGINAQLACFNGSCDTTTGANVTLRASVVEQNHDMGISASSSVFVVDRTVVRGTQPEANDQTGGRGVNLQVIDKDATGADTHVTGTVSSSLIEHNQEIGIVIMGLEGTITNTVVRDTQSQKAAGYYGRGVAITLKCLYDICDPEMPARATVSGLLVEQSRDAGVFVEGSEASIDHSVVRATLPRTFDGLFGDGIAALSLTAPTVTRITTTRVEQSARAGVSNFGASVAIASTHIQCGAFALEGDPFQGFGFAFEDGGGNACGCPNADGACKVVSSGLAPPDGLH
jgi:hypothetical protein